MKGNSKKCKPKRMSLRALKRMGAEVYGKDIYVERGASIGRGAQIYAPCFISADSHIGGGAVIAPFCYIENSSVGQNTVVRSSTLIGAHVGANVAVGPYAYLRSGTEIGDGCRIGDFVEIKASGIGSGTKIAHLAYVGDAQIGKNVNIGCGVVFANYDGKVKRKTCVGDGCFIGCNCNIVAPVSIAEGCYIAAGTTLTHSLKKGDFCIGRSREKIKPQGAAGRYENG